MSNILTIFLIAGALLFVQNAAIAQSNQARWGAEIQEKSLKCQGMQQYQVEDNENAAPNQPAYVMNNGKRLYALDENGNIIGAEKMDKKTIQKLMDEEKQAKQNDVIFLDPKTITDKPEK